MLKQRAKKENESLSPLYILRLFLTPFGLDNKSHYLDQSPMQANEDFLSKAGYKQKMKEIRRYRIASMILWSLIFLALLIYLSFR